MQTGESAKILKVKIPCRFMRKVVQPKSHPTQGGSAKIQMHTSQAAPNRMLLLPVACRCCCVPFLPCVPQPDEAADRPGRDIEVAPYHT
jgi:hypothetical protein